MQRAKGGIDTYLDYTVYSLVQVDNLRKIMISSIPITGPMMVWCRNSKYVPAINHAPEPPLYSNSSNLYFPLWQN